MAETGLIHKISFWERFFGFVFSRLMGGFSSWYLSFVGSCLF